MRTAIKLILFLCAAICAKADTVYVASFYAGSVEKFDTNGVNSPFANDLNSPEQMAFDSAGNLYLANYGGNTVLKFDTNGNASVFANISGGPNGLAFDGAGNLYVATFDGGTIEKFSPTGDDLGAFASGLSHPIVLAFDSATNLYVGTYDDVILKFTNGVATTFAGGVNGPTGMAFDRAGNLYVANFNGNSISEYAANGAFLGNFATNGLNEPYFIAFDSATNLYVANFGNGDVEKITPAGGGSTFATISSPNSLAIWPGLSLAATNVPTDAPFGLKLTPTASGQMTLRFNGNTNMSFTVLASANASTPMANWTALGPATLLSNNVFQFTDTRVTNRVKFYGVCSP